MPLLCSHLSGRHFAWQAATDKMAEWQNGCPARSSTGAMGTSAGYLAHAFPFAAGHLLHKGGKRSGRQIDVENSTAAVVFKREIVSVHFGERNIRVLAMCL